MGCQGIELSSPVPAKYLLKHQFAAEVRQQQHAVLVAVTGIKTILVFEHDIPICDARGSMQNRSFIVNLNQPALERARLGIKEDSEWIAAVTIITSLIRTNDSGKLFTFSSQ